MEITCNRCHQTVHAENCYCPTCGLPQLVYSAEEATPASQAENWPEVVRDASSIDWKFGMRSALLLAIPAGVLCSGVSPLSGFGLVWMAGAAAWAVVLYIRSQRPAWITIGAGARIGLATGLMAAWMAFGVSGGWLFLERVAFHHSNEVDTEWRKSVAENEENTRQLLTRFGVSDVSQTKQQELWMLTPEGHAGYQTFGMAFSCGFLILFATAGGALGAKWLARSRRPEI